jgi:hypothetical protein
MREVGRALNATFKVAVAKEEAKSAACGSGVVTLELPEAGSVFNYIVTMEDLSLGQRISNYSIDFQRKGSTMWEVLVPPVRRKKLALKDRPDGHDPRDQYVGHKRIDYPVWPDADAPKLARKVRFNCITSIQDHDVNIRSFALYKKDVPWEHTPQTDRLSWV